MAVSMLIRPGETVRDVPPVYVEQEKLEINVVLKVHV